MMIFEEDKPPRILCVGTPLTNAILLVKERDFYVPGREIGIIDWVISEYLLAGHSALLLWYDFIILYSF